ncbi:MAG TPA: LysR family transcriptional regulator [Steroidobacteraceae bacterium]|nr:LysR family transcriptional regulator [Steroidobacteraceae bacterium]
MLNSTVSPPDENRGMVDMRLRYIELFHAILTSGSITGAAKLLDISQPAVSKALQHAENQLGIALFSRVRGRIQPTQQAQLLRDRIENIIQEVQELERLTASMSQPGSSPLRVTCTPTLAQVLLPSATVLLRKAFPDVTVELSTEHSAAMCESLTLRETDIGLTLQDTGHQTLRQRVLCRGQVMAIAPPGRWPPEELTQPLPINALASQSLIGITVRDALGSMLQSHLAKIDPAPRTAVAVQTYQLARALVAKGEGMALVDPFTACCGGDANSVQMRPLRPSLEVVLYAMHRPDSPLNRVQKRFLNLVRQLAQGMLAKR